MKHSSFPSDIREISIDQAVVLINETGIFVHEAPIFAGRYAWEQALAAGETAPLVAVETHLDRLIKAGAEFHFDAAMNAGEACRHSWLSAHASARIYRSYGLGARKKSKKSAGSPRLNRAPRGLGTKKSWFFEQMTAREIHKQFGWFLAGGWQKKGLLFSVCIQDGYFYVIESGAPIISAPIRFGASISLDWCRFVERMVEGAAAFFLAQGDTPGRVRMSNRHEASLLSRARKIPVRELTQRNIKFEFGGEKYVAWLEPDYDEWRILTVRALEEII
jgi:hypothetical protein